MFTLSRVAACVTTLLFALVASTPLCAQDVDDPPSRVARLSVVRGDVSFSPAGENDWVEATLNRPLIAGDRLWTGRDARTELQFGGAAVRLDEESSFQILNLDDRTIQVEITQGTLNLRVRRIYQDQIYEIDTPTLAFNVTRPGQYRIDVDPQGQHTTVAVWNGGGDVYGENASFPVRDGEAIRFFNSTLHDYEVYDIPRPDSFDRFCLDRDERFDRAASLRYVPEDLVGYSDLDEYGSWNEVAEYGAVWYPTRVAATWAPYRDGHWIWQDPFGWTWVDHAPWGFAPFHYGRWAYIGNRWGWVPGPIRVRPVYAPALVAFVGGHGWNVGISMGGSGPVGWFPLGPREVYVPPYRVSRRYFTGVNMTNTTINNTMIVNIYNDYSAGRPLRGANYAYRGNINAITAVPGNVFANARSVSAARLAIDREAAARAEITRVAAVAPVQRSVIGAAAAARAIPQRQAIDRSIVARNAPAPETKPFAQRQAGRQRASNEPRVQAEANSSRGRSNSILSERVRVVGGGANIRAPNTPIPRGDISRRGRPVETPRGSPATPQRDVSSSMVRTPLGQDNRASEPHSGRDFGRTARQHPQNVAAPRTPVPHDDTTSAQRSNSASHIERDGSQHPIDRARAEPPEYTSRSAPVLRAEPRPQVQRERPQRLERSPSQHSERSTPVQQQETPSEFRRTPPPQQHAERGTPSPQGTAPEQRNSSAQRRAPAERSRQSRDDAKDGNDNSRRGNDHR